jgi:AraC-like DNA-binding protein
MFNGTFSENLLFFISGFGILQALLLALLIYFHPRSDRSVNLFLSLHIACLGAVLSMPFVMKAVTWQKSFFMEPVPLLIGPFLYLYIRSFKETINWKKALPHLSFAVIYYLVFFIPMNNILNKYSGVKGVPTEVMHEPLTVALGYFRLAQYLFYYFLCRRTIASYQHSIRKLFSETSRIDLQWIRWLINGFLFLIAATLVIYSLMLRFPEQFPLLFLINVAIATPYIYMATIKGITQSTLWKSHPEISRQTIEKELEETNSSITVDPKIKEISTRVITLMETEKLFQETELTLQNLADKLKLPSYQVSQAINEGMKKTFYDLVNGYRVAEAKRLLLDPDNNNYTVLSVGFEAGFNSKTTFNTVFKKFTGMTPTEYKMAGKPGV